MESESIFGTQQARPEPGAPVAPPPPSSSGDPVSYDNPNHTNVAGLFMWLAAIIAVAGTVFLWFLNSSTTQALADQNSEKDKIVSEIVSPTYVDVETKATSFKTAVDQLSQAVASRYSVGAFLPKFYAHINKNVSVNNISIGTDGKLSFDGTTTSYKGVAQQVATLTDWSVDSKKVLSNVQLLSVSEDISSGVVAKFAISATIDKKIDLATVATSAASPTTTTPSTTEGGN